MTASVSVQFGEDGQTRVHSNVRLTASTHILCCTYDDAAPILSLRDGSADITITSPGRGKVTEDDVTFAHQLADAVNRYADELDKLATKARAAAGPGEPGGQAA